MMMSIEIGVMLHNSTRASLDEAMDRVSPYYGVTKDSLMQVNKRSGNLSRIVGMYLSQGIGQYTLFEIARFYTNISADGVIKYCRRVDVKLDGNKQLEVDISWFKCNLG